MTRRASSSETERGFLAVLFAVQLLAPSALLAAAEPSQEANEAEPVRVFVRQCCRVDHATLRGWRRAAIAAFFPADLHLTREELEQPIERLNQPADGRLPEFAFRIRGYARSLLT